MWLLLMLLNSFDILKIETDFNEIEISLNLMLCFTTQNISQKFELMSFSNPTE